MNTKSDANIERKWPVASRLANSPRTCDGYAERHARQLDITKLTGRVAVESKRIDSAGGQAGDFVLVGKSNNTRAKSSGRHLALEAQEVSTETGDMGSGHRGSGDGVLVNVSTYKSLR